MDQPTMDLEYLTARLHGRKSRLAEGDRLEALFPVKTVGNLTAVLYPAEKLEDAAELQRKMVEDWAREMAWIAAGLRGARQRYMAWIVARLALENLKVILRGVRHGLPPDLVKPNLVALPPDWASDALVLSAAKSISEAVGGLPDGTLRDIALEAARPPGNSDSQFLLEAALDRGYLAELLARAADLPREDADAIHPLACQEADLFHLMLVAGGHFLRQIPPDDLRPLHIPGTRIDPRRFNRMLTDPTLETAAARAVSLAIDALPTPLDPISLERAGWQRLLRLARRAFRLDHMGFGAVAGYAVLRRLEVANLIAVSEGVRLTLPADEISPALTGRGRHP